MGDDFEFQEGELAFSIIDSVIANFNQIQDDFELFYSTPQTYFDAVHAEEIRWPYKTTDMFPYANQYDSYWTGTYTSRPNTKSQARKASSHQHAASHLFAKKVIDQNATDGEID